MEHVYLIITHLHTHRVALMNIDASDSRENTARSSIFNGAKSNSCSSSYVGVCAIHSIWTTKTDGAFFFSSFSHCHSHSSMSSNFLGVCCFSRSPYCLIGKNRIPFRSETRNDGALVNSDCTAIIVKNLRMNRICRTRASAYYILFESVFYFTFSFIFLSPKVWTFSQTVFIAFSVRLYCECDSKIPLYQFFLEFVFVECERGALKPLLMCWILSIRFVAARPPAFRFWWQSHAININLFKLIPFNETRSSSNFCLWT